MERAPARHYALAACAVALLAGSFAALGTGCDDARPRGPIVLVVIDTLRADHLSCYGYTRPTSPHLCSLQADGLRFTRAYTTFTYTTPAIASMLTGLYPNRHGVRDLYLRLPSEMTTLAERMTAAGYRSGAFVSSFVMVGDFSGFAQGFEVYDDDVHTREAFRENYQRPAADTVERALTWLAAAGPKAFLFVHLIEPHGPYTPPEPFLHEFARTPAGPTVPIDRVPKSQRIPGLTYLSQYTDHYDGEIAAADASVGTLLARLHELRWYDQATIALVADHGELMGEDGFWFVHGHTVDEGEAHVPLFVKFAGDAADVPRGTEVDVPVSVVDLFPTLLRSAGLPVDGTMQGVDLRGVAARRQRSGPPPLTLRNSGRKLLVAAHGRKCAARWELAPPALQRGFLLADTIDTSDWPSVATTTLVPPDAPDTCGEALTAAAAPLMDELLRYRLPFTVVSRDDANRPEAKKSFIENRHRQGAVLGAAEKEALRRLGYAP